MDFMGDFFGTNPASPEEREAEKARLLREAELDHVIVNGKVYVNGEEVARVYRKVAQMLVVRAFLTQDVLSKGMAGGMEAAAKIVQNISGELLRREAEAIIKADDGV